MSKDFLQIFNLKPAHFNDGWACFDGVTAHDISTAIAAGCKILNENFNCVRIFNVLTCYSGMMCFGKISLDGIIKLEGLTGFPINDSCINYLNHISKTAKRKKITENYVFIEF